MGPGPLIFLENNWKEISLDDAWINFVTLNESVNQASFLYPMHRGSGAYLRRGQPTFFERYAELMAYAFSIGAVLFGALQAIRRRIMARKKERIDQYFLDYLDIRSRTIKDPEKHALLDELLKRAMIQMTSEKLDKLDFYILSRILQQEMLTLNQ